jgi:murein DD-endopeptidase MepM/ murein hydrolase activator NlpD
MTRSSRVFLDQNTVPNFSSILFRSPRSRGIDVWGSGQYHAPRDENTRPHDGLDIAASIGELVRSPIDGNITREAVPYRLLRGILSGIYIEGIEQFEGYSVKMFYIDVKATLCGPVKAGSIIGNVQDIRWRYPGITNHVHLEVRWKGQLISPVDAFRMCF